MNVDSFFHPTCDDYPDKSFSKGLAGTPITVVSPAYIEIERLAPRCYSGYP